MKLITPPTDVIIIGSGVVGLSLAWELARQGATVRVCERDKVGRGASWAGAGILPPASPLPAVDPYEQLCALSHQNHPLWAQRLREETGIDTGFRRCGGIYLARTSGEAATLAANHFWWNERGIANEPWSPERLSSGEPELLAVAPELKSAWFLPDECQLRNPHHLQALAQACRRQAVDIIEDAQVLSLLLDHGRVAGVQLARGQVFAKQVCICSGAWARQSLEQLGLANGIMPVRGQMILYKGESPPLKYIVNEGHRYLVPRADGHTLAGSIEEEVGYRCETTQEGIGQIRQWAESVLPILKRQEIKQTWAGLRPGSFDGFPYLGRIPTIDNLFIAAGHFRSGLHLSCGTAIVMAEIMLDRPSPIDLTPFRPGRG